MPRKMLGRVGTICLKHVIIFKRILISHKDYFSHFKAMQSIEVCRATFSVITGLFFLHNRMFFLKNAKKKLDHLGKLGRVGLPETHFYWFRPIVREIAVHSVNPLFRL